MYMYLGWLSFVMLYLVEDIDIMNHGEPDTQDSFYDEENDQYLLCQAQSGSDEVNSNAKSDVELLREALSADKRSSNEVKISPRSDAEPFFDANDEFTPNPKILKRSELCSSSLSSQTPVSTRSVKHRIKSSENMGETPVKKHLPAIPSLSTCVETTPPNCLGTTNQLPSHYLLAIERLQKNVDKLIAERNMLREERDETKGRLLYLEHSLSEKEREHQVCLQELNKERRERVEAQQALEKYRRRSDEEIDLLRTQLQFNTEHERANAIR